MEIDLTVAEVVRDQAEAMCTDKYSLVAGLFNPNSPVPKTSGHLLSHSPSQGVKAAHSTSSKRKLDDENDLKVCNEIIDQIVTEKELPQAYGPAILKNLASAVTKFWQTEARNGQEIKKLRTKFPQAYGPAILKNLASAVTKFWQTEARNGQDIKKLKTEYFCYLKLLKVLCPYTE